MHYCITYCNITSHDFLLYCLVCHVMGPGVALPNMLLLKHVNIDSMLVLKMRLECALLKMLTIIYYDTTSHDFV